MRKALRFLHTADLHLDSPFKGMTDVPEQLFQQMVTSTFQSFDRVIEAAIEYQVDFVLMVGDLFDEEARSLKAQIKLRRGLEKLHENQIEVFISFGNHDHLGGEFLKLDYPENVHIFDREEVTSIPFFKQGEHLANLYGFSYEQRAVTAPKITEYNPTKESIYHLGMLHGSLSTNQGHDVYAPFSITDLSESEMDYWALGHIHKREQLLQSPPTIYPGNIQGRHIKESGEKGCYIVDLIDEQCHLNFVPTQQIQFTEAVVDATDCSTIDEVEQIIQQEKDLIRTEIGKAVIRIQLKLDLAKMEQFTEEQVGELVDMINEEEESEKIWVWTEKLRLEKIAQWDREELREGRHFIGEFLRVIDDSTEWEESLNEITKHREIRKLLEPFTEEELAEMKDDAEQMVLESLMKE
ncbi:metallophosphoesterase family protein [Salinibacillus xinjiangensis]|nr:DNA repair exonuclease [Salinibacillus xinjiangensis]